MFAISFRPAAQPYSFQKPQLHKKHVKVTDQIPVAKKLCWCIGMGSGVRHSRTFIINGIDRL
jgi:hypothetical protein